MCLLHILVICLGPDGCRPNLFLIKFVMDPAFASGDKVITLIYYRASIFNQRRCEEMRQRSHRLYSFISLDGGVICAMEFSRHHQDFWRVLRT